MELIEQFMKKYRVEIIVGLVVLIALVLKDLIQSLLGK